MPLFTIDIILRAATITLLLLLAALMLRDYGRTDTGRLGAALALGSAAHAASFAIGSTSPIAIGHGLLIAISTGNIVIFWLFTRALFDDGFVLRRRHALLWVAVAGFSLLNCTVIAPTSVATVWVSVVAINLLVLGFISLALVQTLASWSADLVEGRRRVRVFIIIAAAVYGGLNAILEIALLGRGGGEIANAANAAVLTAIVAAIAWALMNVGGDEVFSAASGIMREPVPPAAVATDGVADQKLMDALMRMMADERIYRQENVTIGMLAARLAIPEYRLRRLINQRLAYRNFNVFLNNHRIEEAKAALADPAQAEVPVLTIALDAGFQSLGPFNRAFKAITGVTPSEYRRNNAVVA